MAGEYEIGWSMGFAFRDAFDELKFLIEEDKKVEAMALASTLYGDAHAAAARGITAAGKMQTILSKLVDRIAGEDWGEVERLWGELKKIARSLPG